MTSQPHRHAEAILQACRRIETAEKPVRLDDLAHEAGLSPFHFHRQFKAVTGLTPKAYEQAKRARTVRQTLDQGSSVTEAIYEAGYSSNSRFYERSEHMLGMTPTTYRKGGAGASIRFAIAQCSLGAILVAATSKGVCCILLGDDAAELARDLQDRFPKAELIGADAGFETWVAKVIGFVEQPALGLDLPLDIQGTAFQQRVWQALRDIPAGETATYAEVADYMGDPKAVRAVAGACAANKIAVAIPCHRVIRTDGGLSSYRWGVERKKTLLAREASARV